MKKLLPIIGWTCALLVFLIPGLLIMHFGYENMMLWARIALYGTNWLVIIKGIVIAFIYLIVDIFGLAFIITSFFVGIYIIREYIIPKKINDKTETDEDGYTEV